MGRMSEQRRRDLAYQCRRRRRTLLVIDEVNVFYVCAARGPRLPVLMRCCLPFTVADPYTTTAGLVPEEMFFGRRRERELIVERYGTNLVYGGRRLGQDGSPPRRRATLPRPSTRRVHPMDRSAGRGHRRNAADRRCVGRSWRIALKKLGVLSHTAQRPETIQRNVTDWLAGDDRRRIVLLLDEADAFLESDSKAQQPYANLNALKGMMDATGRGFKVVFAGLHNVQRTSRDINTPLAHLGEPICIGPLLGGGEAREAIEMVTVPLAALGYRFDPPDLPLRVLSHTNYYPSLIQLFCKELLEHLASIAVFDPKASPPYTVTAGHLEEAYQSQKLRKAILHRFNLTLDLDPRYRLIA